jgi:hypothetical protein
MGPDPLFTIVEAKNADFFASNAVMKGSAPMKSTASIRRHYPKFRSDAQIRNSIHCERP